MPGQTIRTFIALEIEEKIKEKIIQIQDKINQSNCLKAKWVPKDNLHLTLKFLGDTKVKDIKDIKDKIKETVEIQPINCTVDEAGAFPSEESPRVVWVGIGEGKNQITNLAIKLEESLALLGFKKEKREFKTHITICRTKQIINPQRLKDILREINDNFQPLKFSANKITFFESKLTPHGSIYTVLSDYLL